MKVGLWWKLSAKELMLLNCGVGEDSWESLGLQGDPSSPFRRRAPWDFFGRTDAEAETPVLWPPDAKSWLIGKDPDAGKDWGQEKGMTGWDGWMASLSLSELQELVIDMQMHERSWIFTKEQKQNIFYHSTVTWNLWHLRCYEIQANSFTCFDFKKQSLLGGIDYSRSYP